VQTQHFRSLFICPMNGVSTGSNDWEKIPGLVSTFEEFTGQLNTQKSFKITVDQGDLFLSCLVDMLWNLPHDDRMPLVTVVGQHAIVCSKI
jgi:hypothetical protein